MQEPPILPAQTMACPRCSAPLAAEQLDRLLPVACPGCHVSLTGAVFSAFWQPAPVLARTDQTASEGDASCYFHPGKKAELACERCGRFICGLCEVPLGSRRLCPTCLGNGLRSTTIPELQMARFCWGNFALLTGALPLLVCLFLWPLFVVSGPAAIFAAFFGWEKPGSLIHGPRRWAAVLGALCGLLQLIGFLAMIGFLWKVRT